MKKIFITIILCFVCTICSSCFLSFGSQKSEDEIARDLILRNSKIEVPLNSDIIFQLRDKESKGCVHGGNFQYTVFLFKSAPMDWLNKNSFENSLDKNKSKQFERYYSSVLSSKPEKLGGIPQEFLPNLNEFYYYLQTEDVYFVYTPQNLKLITIIPND